MNLALLGDDPTIWPLLMAVSRSNVHRLSVAALPGRLATDLSTRLPQVRQTDRWDQLLVDTSIEAVIVAGRSEAALEAARRLASEGKPLFLWPHGGETAFAYELSLVRDDAKAPLIPLFPLRFDPAISALKDRIVAGELGRILHLQWERRIPADPSLVVPLLRPEDMEEQLAGDADILRALGGNYDRVTALRTGVVDDRASSTTVTLSGDNLPEATWQLNAVAAPPSTVEPPGTAQWTLTVVGTTGRASVTSDAARLDFDKLFRKEAPEGKPAGGGWGDLLRVCETVDAARRSLKRRRTIDLHFETASERSQFKTQMTAIGCGILFLTLLLVGAVMLVGSAFDVPPALMKIARVLAFAPLFVFLALQLLIVVARPSSA
jgi:myo-inositol 2-dehydrogenase/D-chiro-inositol 1-dehydrogenase